MRRLGPLALVLALAACDGTTLSEDAFAEIPLTPGISRAELVDDGGQTVRLSLSVPEGLGPGDRVPLVVALHWSGEVTPFYGEAYLRALAAPGLEGLGAIVVAPDRLGDDWERPASRDLVLSVVRRAVDLWPVDPDRVVVTGYSMGGFGTWTYLADYRGTFAAGIPMAAYPITDGGGRPVYVVHSRDDDLYAFFDTERAVERLRQRGLPVTLAPVDGPSHTEPTAYVPALREAAAWLEREVW